MFRLRGRPSSDSLEKGDRRRLSSHLEEYNEMIKSNIHPIVLEDDSVTCNTSLDMSMSLSGWEKYEDMRATVESLQQELIQKNKAMTQLQDQLTDEKRAHSKLKKRWNLFFGNNKKRAANAADLGGALDTTSVVIQRLGAKLEELEQENRRFKEKTIDLCVELTESKAKSSRLEAQLDEAYAIVDFQNSFPMGFWKVHGADLPEKEREQQQQATGQEQSKQEQQRQPKESSTAEKKMTKDASSKRNRKFRRSQSLVVQGTSRDILKELE